jgi:hypothetical protein
LLALLPLRALRPEVPHLPAAEAGAGRPVVLLDLLLWRAGPAPAVLLAGPDRPGPHHDRGRGPLLRRACLLQLRRLDRLDDIQGGLAGRPAAEGARRERRRVLPLATGGRALPLTKFGSIGRWHGPPAAPPTTFPEASAATLACFLSDAAALQQRSSGPQAAGYCLRRGGQTVIAGSLTPKQNQDVMT